MATRTLYGMIQLDDDTGVLGTWDADTGAFINELWTQTDSGEVPETYVIRLDGDGNVYFTTRVVGVVKLNIIEPDASVLAHVTVTLSEAGEHVVGLFAVDTAGVYLGTLDDASTMRVRLTDDTGVVLDSWELGTGTGPYGLAVYDTLGVSYLVWTDSVVGVLHVHNLTDDIPLSDITLSDPTVSVWNMVRDGGTGAFSLEVGELGILCITPSYVLASCNSDGSGVTRYPMPLCLLPSGAGNSSAQKVGFAQYFAGSEIDAPPYFYKCNTCDPSTALLLIDPREEYPTATNSGWRMAVFGPDIEGSCPAPPTPPPEPYVTTSSRWKLHRFSAAIRFEGQG